MFGSLSAPALDGAGERATADQMPSFVTKFFEQASNASKLFGRLTFVGGSAIFYAYFYAICTSDQMPSVYC